MFQKTYFLVCGLVFLVVATAHFARLIAGWEIAIGGWLVPLWVSFPGLIIPGFLSACGFILAWRDTAIV